MISSVFQTILYQPLLNILVFIYNIIPGHDIGISIIILTFIIRFALYPLSRKSLESQKALQEIQPKMDDIKKLYKNDKEKQAKELMKLYSASKVNPFSSCLPVLIQLPFFIAVFQVFRTGLSKGSLDLLYPFVTNPGVLNAVSMGFIDLSKPQPVLAVLAAVGQYFQTKMMMSNNQPKVKGAEDESVQSIMNKQMVFMMPLMTVIIGMSLPGGLTLYWLVTTLLMLVQQKKLFTKTPIKEVVSQITK